MSYTLCTSQAIIRKAGVYANADAIASGAFLAECCDFAEGQVVEATRWNWVTNYSAVNAHVKNALADVTSDIAAMKVINYDMTGATKAEFQVRLDVLSDNSNRIIANLKNADSNSIRTVD